MPRTPAAHPTRIQLRFGGCHKLFHQSLPLPPPPNELSFLGGIFFPARITSHILLAKQIIFNLKIVSATKSKKYCLLVAVGYCY